MLRFTVSLLAMAILPVSACGTETQDDPFGSGEDVHAGPFENAINWHNPIGGVEVGTLGQAQEAVPFDIYKPRALGAPTDILMTPLDEGGPEDRVLALIYETKEFGLVVVQEHLPDVPVEEYQAGLGQLVEQGEGPNTQGSASLVTIRDGVEALLTVSEDESRAELWWLQDDSFEMIVRGPDLDANACIALSNLI